MKATGYVVRYTDTRTNTQHTLRSAMTSKPYKKLAAAETTASRVRGYDFTADVRVETA